MKMKQASGLGIRKINQDLIRNKDKKIRGSQFQKGNQDSGAKVCSMAIVIVVLILAIKLQIVHLNL